jgi:hypothetical protein
MKISEFISELRQRNVILFKGGRLNVFLTLLFIIMILVDDRTVLGINTWIKPMKFSISFIIFLWTFAWILYYLPDKRKVFQISIGLYVCMIMEIVTITLQAARGQTSHYNQSTVFNMIIFAIMGLFIFINTLIIIYIIIQFLKPTPSLDGAIKIVIVGGLIVFLLGSLSGGMMVSHGAHSVGVADGGEGLFFLNWNTKAGDLRTAHFFTLHALQFIPLIFLGLGQLIHKTRALAVIVISMYSLLCLYLHMQAMAGKPLLAF